MQDPASSQALVFPASADREQVLATRPERTSATELALAVESCRSALQTGEMLHATDVLRHRGFSPSDAKAMIEQVGRDPEAAKRIAAFRESLFGERASNAVLERCLLLQTAAEYGGSFARASMGEGVLSCLADELRFLSMPDDQEAAKLLAPSDHFVTMAKIVTLRRFPAGQLHFERSGIPLSWSTRLGPRRLTTLLLFLLRRTRGRRPFFFHHLAWRRGNRLFLSEREQNRSYWRIAQALALHPDVKGLLTESWLHSPDTFEVSSHLAWLNKPFLEHGGLVLRLGAASADSGVFAASRERRRLYAEGRFRPTTAMVIWPRAAMLEWAANHPELGT